MRKIAVLDVSIFIWDEDHFESNKVKYYEIIDPVLNILDLIKREKVLVAFNSELINEIQYYFPYENLASGFYYFELAVLGFLTSLSTKQILYKNESLEKINSIPNLCKSFFKNTTKTEIEYLITYLYENKYDTNIILTFSVFYDSENNLIVKNGKLKEVETILCDDVNEHRKIISKFKKIFEHNPKHDKYNSGGDVSALRCYNDRDKDVAKAQKLLDSSVYYNDSYHDGYFNYDEENNTFVKFVLTVNNLYHGFEITLTEHVEATIRKLLNNGN